MTLVVQNASSTFAKALRALAKLDGATVKTKRKNAIEIALEQIKNGEVERFSSLEDFKAAMEK